MKKIIYIFNILVFFLLPFHIGLAKEEMDIESFIKKDFKGELDPNQIMGVKQEMILDEKIKNADPNKLLTLLANYDKETSSSPRRTTLFYEMKIAKLHPSKEIRQKVANRLVNTMVEPNSIEANNAYEGLLTFTKDDFNKSSKVMLHNALAKKYPSGELIKICGVADMKEELTRLKELSITREEIEKNINDPYGIVFPWYYILGWYAKLARARIGIKEDIVECIELAESVKDSNERVLRVLPQIAYIRQPEAIEYLKKYLDSDGHLPPTTPIARFGESYSHWVMDILAKSLKNFPVKQKLGRNYTQEDIELCRKWTSEQTEWQIIR